MLVAKGGLGGRKKGSEDMCDRRGKEERKDSIDGACTDGSEFSPLSFPSLSCLRFRNEDGGDDRRRRAFLE